METTKQSPEKEESDLLETSHSGNNMNIETQQIHEAEECAAGNGADSTESPPDVSNAQTHGTSPDNSQNNSASSTSGADKSDAVADIDPYAYLKRDEFTSEIFKVEIMNLPKRFGMAQLRKRLISLGLKPCKLKAVEKGGYAFANFRCEEDREEALRVLPNHVWKGRSLGAKKASPSADPLLKKRKLEAEKEGQPESKQSKIHPAAPDNRPIAEILNDAVTSYWRKPYAEQLLLKEDEMKGFIRKTGNLVGGSNWEMKSWLKEQRTLNSGLICKFNPIKRSPKLDNYRNKCEFTIGTGPNGEEKVVGFRTGSYKSGSVRVVEPHECVNIPQSMKDTARLCQHYLQNISTFPAYDPAAKEGKWKTVMIRTNQRGHVMCVFEFNPEATPKGDIETEADKIKEYFTMGDGKEMNIYSLYLLIKSHRHEKDMVDDYRLLLGEKELEEDLLDMKFRISPSAFFQVNTPAAEVLYSTIADWCHISDKTVLLDVCCGTGTIGITMAKRVKQIVGIDIVQEAIADAKENAKLNGVENADFYAGKAEDVLPILIKRYYGQDVVAVVDPPRNGLHPKVIQALRKATFVKRLVYVSCKPKEITNNVLDLTRSESRRVRGPYFRLTEVVPVDLFPHTEHCELVLLFEREIPQKEESISSNDPQPEKHISDVKDSSADIDTSPPSDDS